MVETTGEPVLHKTLTAHTKVNVHFARGACKEWLFNNETSFNPATLEVRHPLVLPYNYYVN